MRACVRTFGSEDAIRVSQDEGARESDKGTPTKPTARGSPKPRNAQGAEWKRKESGCDASDAHTHTHTQDGTMGTRRGRTIDYVALMS